MDKVTSINHDFIFGSGKYGGSIEIRTDTKGKTFYKVHTEKLTRAELGYILAGIREALEDKNA